MQARKPRRLKIILVFCLDASLLNTLLDYSITTNEKKIVMEKDMLFATLDTSTSLI